MPTPEFIDANTLADWLADGSVDLIDVREEPEFAQARIAGSRLIPLSGFDPAAVALPADRKVVFHCKSGVRCGHAVERMIAGGSDRQFYRLQGGLMGWVQSGHPVEPGS
ncbi:MAG: rhodanese-like domain-containing protein [Thalassobaculaceae bacterium]|nr:rhodanese-like domain-containing protein [Thalassobaculaceae bacterium]